MTSYLSGRTLWDDTDEGQYYRTYCWSLSCGVLVLPVPKQTTMLDFEDDLAGISRTEQSEDVKVYANEPMKVRLKSLVE